MTPARTLTREMRDKLSPDQIIQAMKKGNGRFRKGERKDRNYLREQKASASGQYPAAALLSCIDSRAPAEVIMDLGIGDIFNCRIAGNIENADILGSLEFACKLAGAKVVLVMGHTACGAIKGPSTTRSSATSPGCSPGSSPRSKRRPTPATGRPRTTPSSMPSHART